MTFVCLRIYIYIQRKLKLPSVDHHFVGLDESYTRIYNFTGILFQNSNYQSSCKSNNNLVDNFETSFDVLEHEGEWMELSEDGSHGGLAIARHVHSKYHQKVGVFC